MTDPIFLSPPPEYYLAFRAEVEAAVAVRPAVLFLDEAESDRVVETAATRFGFSPEVGWWWQDMPAEHYRKAYGRGERLPRMRALLPGDRPLVLFFTDDNAPPWFAAEGTADDLIAVMGELRAMEFMVSDREGSFVAMDMHHDVIYAVGLSAPT
ncbi:MAG TPA: hypothetical protein VGM88_25190 [Kofleriaceae bacterium]|jgi:hypothetical protein